MKVRWYKGGDFDEVEPTDYFCPNCGQKSVHVEKGEGDYYHGPSYYCLACKLSFTFNGRICDNLEVKE